jgi:1,4-dihydroxy-2-naphthoate octaprenyltransferase
MGLLTMNILVVNNLRDRVEDSRTGKRTLAVRFGKHFVMHQALLCLVLSYLIPLYFCWSSARPWPLLLPALTLPMARRWYLAIGTTEGRAMNDLLAKAGQLLLVYALLFSISIVISP